MRRVLYLFPCLVLAVSGQQAPPPSQELPTFRAEARLVVQQVTVKDKSGKPIQGLTAHDFTITESGIPQNIAFLEFQKLEETQPTPALTERVAPLPRLPHMQIASAGPNEVRYADRRLLALYFDMTGMPPADQSRAIGAARTSSASR